MFRKSVARFTAARDQIRDTWHDRDLHQADFKEAWGDRRQRWADTDRQTRFFVLIVFLFLGAALFYLLLSLRSGPTVDPRPNIAKMVAIAERCSILKEPVQRALRDHAYSDATVSLLSLQETTANMGDRYRIQRHQQPICVPLQTKK